MITAILFFYLLKRNKKMIMTLAGKSLLIAILFYTFFYVLFVMCVRKIRRRFNKKYLNIKNIL